jgi:3-deoxy-7-phosphoheptulonate synthase
MVSTNNINIASRSILSSPGQIRSELPLSIEAAIKVARSREEIKDILDGKNRKLMMIVGPCSIHDPDAALEYAGKLKELADKVSDRIYMIMRVYFEKPRTTIGWKGLINDPDINGSYNIDKGLFMARNLLLQIIDIGLPAATEMLDPIIAQYLADAVSWAAIGARTTEAQTHRQLGSGLSMPVGFKNATDGSFQIAIDAVATARSSHNFIGIMEDGHVGVFRTKGNEYGHIVLRGGPQPNYGAEHIAFLRVALKKADLKPMIVVDCSHANSGKDYRKQRVALDGVLEQIASGENAICGVMLESNIKPGSQKVVPGVMPDPELSITDGCIGWEETDELIMKTWEVVRKAREKQN